MAREPLSQARRLVLLRDARDAFDADELDEDMRSLEDERTDGPQSRAGVNDRDRRAVAVAEEDDTSSSWKCSMTAGSTSSASSCMKRTGRGAPTGSDAP